MHSSSTFVFDFFLMVMVPVFIEYGQPKNESVSLICIVHVFCVKRTLDCFYEPSSACLTCLFFSFPPCVPGLYTSHSYTGNGKCVTRANVIIACYGHAAGWFKLRRQLKISFFVFCILMPVYRVFSRMLFAASQFSVAPLHIHERHSKSKLESS